MTHTPEHPAGLTGDPRADADALIAGAGGTAPPQDEPGVIGGFDGGIAQGATIWPGWAQNLGVGLPPTAMSSAPLYREGDQFSWLRAKPLEERIRIQDELLALGLTSSVIPGEFDDGTLTGMRTLMTLANRNGERVEQTIGRLRSLEAQGLLRPAEKEPVFNFVSREFLPPDPATIDEDIRSMVGKMFAGTDIEVSDEEVASLRRQFTGLLREQHFNEEQQRLSEEHVGFQAQVASAEGRNVNLEVDAVPQVDAGARFRELFAERFKPKTDAIDQMGVDDQSRQLTQEGLSRVMQFALGR